MPKLTIDGKEIEVPKGTRLIEAAKKVAIDVPYYCYHPGLSIAGNCRMCLVEVEQMPKLQIACHIEAQEGMTVKTASQKVLETRKHILEFLLVNHPLDCPVCDQAGECWLQDYYMKHGLYDSRVNENKIKKPKAVSIGPTIILDAERCILCSRCVRFTDEISKTHELGIVGRGDHSEIQVFPEKELNNPYSGNVVDICPVGALTDKDFRFKVRVWYLGSGDSICNGCSRGCNIQIQTNTTRPHHSQGDRVMRLKPRFNENINKWWICDEGRYGYKFHDKNRITAPLKRVGHVVHELSWDEILPEAAKDIQTAKGKIGVFISPQLSNEEIYLIKKLFNVVGADPCVRPRMAGARIGAPLQIKSFLVSPNPEGFQDDFLIRADKNPNSEGAELLGFHDDPKAVHSFFSQCELGEIDGIVVFGQDLLTLHGPHLAEKGLKKIKWSIFIGSNHNLMSEFATYVLPSTTYAEKEGTFTNFEGRVQKFNQVLQPLGGSRPEFKILKGLAGLLGVEWLYETVEDVFKEFIVGARRAVPLQQKLGVVPLPEASMPTYESLQTGGSDMRVLAMPVIPALEQEANIL